MTTYRCAACDKRIMPVDPRGYCEDCAAERDATPPDWVQAEENTPERVAARKAMFNGFGWGTS